MKIIEEKLTETYFNDMFVLLEREKLPLKKWLLIQKNLWQRLVNDGYVRKNDSNAFYAVGKFFDDYFQKTGHIVDYMHLITYVGGYL